ncbi:hypothetical protein KDN34_07385 [Shewanella yunxiaonensis]|uniref:Uncharacterized protein n=1 Tax=Shewanella yunxiaonensis TaxID=2829809 RepID=A0ABX7YX32_9GAMM|nr:MULTISPECIES: hypothetical protein [Shewanella]MDF0535383.1 hypothetical protein [Shewanella sp. A32]QUN07237.1 hypothetical protein KDN34_07385 [Shewanella yunxiaonensis]
MAPVFKVEQSLREHSAQARTIWCAESERCDYVVMEGDDEVHFTDYAQPGRLQLLKATGPIQSAEALLEFATNDYQQRYSA